MNVRMLLKEFFEAGLICDMCSLSIFDGWLAPAFYSSEPNDAVSLFGFVLFPSHMQYIVKS